MKVFYLNEYYWWMSDTLENAIREFKDFCQTIGEDYDEVDEPYELSQEDLDRCTFEGDSETYPFSEELRRQLANGAKPGIFAYSE